ncbi:DUF1080 domain-containing protein [bacterium]|nr:DUF1080 domain-containing protein [bacterium]
MALLADSDCVDLTVGAPDPERGAAAFRAAAVAVARDRQRRDAGDGFQWLFNGDGVTHWATVGAGTFVMVDDRLESVPADDLGLFWCTIPAPANFLLRLQWLRWRQEDASGVFVRFPHPEPCSEGNPAFSAIYRGFEVQIDELGLPGASAIHRTGAIFGQRDQRLRPPKTRPPAEWNDLEIAVRGQSYVVRLNGEVSTEFENRDPARGLPTTRMAPSYIGLQISPGSRVAFRRIAIKALP